MLKGADFSAPKMNHLNFNYNSNKNLITDLQNPKGRLSNISGYQMLQ